MKRRISPKKNKLTFGKFYGKHISSVPYYYLNWLLENVELCKKDKQLIDKWVRIKAERIVEKEISKKLRWINQS